MLQWERRVDHVAQMSHVYIIYIMDEQGSLDNRCSISLRFDGATESVSLCHNAQANAGRSDTQVSQSPPQYLALHNFFETSYFFSSMCC